MAAGLGCGAFVVSFRGHRLGLVFEPGTERLAEAVQRMYAPYLSERGGDDAPATLVVRAAVLPSGGEAVAFAAWGGVAAEPHRRPPPLPSGPVAFGDAVSLIRARIQYQLCTDAADCLMLHAASARRDGRMLVFPALSGSGKTSLCAWLCGQGFEVQGDELVAVDADGRWAQGFRHPLNVKHRGLDLVRGMPWLEAMQAAAVSVPVGELWPWVVQPQTRPAPLCGLIFITWSAGASLQTEPLGAATAAAILLRCLVNARNLPLNGGPWVLRLARQTPTWRVVYSDYDELLDWLDTQLPGQASA